MRPTRPRVRAVIEQTQHHPRCGYAAHSEAAGRPAARVEANLQGAMLLRCHAVPGHELARMPRWGWATSRQRVFTFLGSKSYVPVTINRIFQFWKGSICFRCLLQLRSVWPSTYHTNIYLAGTLEKRTLYNLWSPDYHRSNTNWR